MTSSTPQVDAVHTRGASWTLQPLQQAHKWSLCVVAQLADQLCNLPIFYSRSVLTTAKASNEYLSEVDAKHLGQIQQVLIWNFSVTS